MSDKGLIRVLSVDDHEIMRGGIQYLLLAIDDIELVGEARSGEEAVELCDILQPDVVLMDMRMPSMDGIQTTQLIRERYPDIQVLALTSFEEEQMIQQAMQAGAIGYLQKGISVDELVDAIRAAQAGRPTLSPVAFKALIQGNESQPQQPDFELTARELQVLEMLVYGLSNTEIAEQLVITVATVKYHISNILKKLGAANRTEAAVLAIEHHLASKS